jgi:hypothetical protein
MIWKLLKLTCAPMGQNNFIDSDTPGSNNFFLNSTHGQHFSGEGNFTGHGKGSLVGFARGQRNQCCGNGDTGTGTILGNSLDFIEKDQIIDDFGQIKGSNSYTFWYEVKRQR